ncbi:TetR/AcrR family transcriptional regulator [Arthrobacter sp. JSM 101049]|uniref:TetR/AcrR family transcriptional regulator n=1 Tax=Arthrobacter sp. JSM 101049 TaxID=929097 RepID=UPI003565DBD3
MNESATGDLGPRERRRRETYAALTTHARTLTADRGLNGFTIEELCEAVGVSRRTFFNYFATKEDAVLGAKSADPLEPFAQAFLDSGPVAAANGPGSAQPVPLKDAMLELIVQVYASMEVPPTDVHEYMQVMHSEPALMKRMIESARQRQRDLAELIARREGLPAGDPFADAAAALASHLTMSSFERFFGHGEGCDGATEAASAIDETPTEAQERYTALLTEVFDHAARFFQT